MARMFVEVSDVPVIADADTGFGVPLNVARTIGMYEAAGLAGCHIEDQTFPKRCGQRQSPIDLLFFGLLLNIFDAMFLVVEGKDVEDIDTYIGRIIARRYRTSHDQHIARRKYCEAFLVAIHVY